MIDPYHLLRSLTYFADAEAEPMPDVLGEITCRHAVAWDVTRQVSSRRGR